MDIKKLEVSPEREVGGVWHKLDSVTSIKVARYGNDKFSNKLQELVASLPKAPKFARVEVQKDEEYDGALNRIIADTILVDWKGMMYAGEEVPYSPEKAYEYLSDPKLKDFREHVLKLAMEASHYRDSQIEEAVGN